MYLNELCKYHKLFNFINTYKKPSALPLHIIYPLKNCRIELLDNLVMKIAYSVHFVIRFREKYQKLI